MVSIFTSANFNFKGVDCTYQNDVSSAIVLCNHGTKELRYESLPSQAVTTLSSPWLVIWFTLGIWCHGRIEITWIELNLLFKTSDVHTGNRLPFIGKFSNRNKLLHPVSFITTTNHKGAAWEIVYPQWRVWPGIIGGQNTLLETTRRSRLSGRDSN